MGKPDRYVYMFTEKGLQELQHWLAEPSEPQIERIEILLKLCFEQQVAVTDNIHHVQQFRQRQLLQKYQAIEEDTKDIYFCRVF